MLKFLEATNGMKPSHVFGKPSPSLLTPVLLQFGKYDEFMATLKKYDVEVCALAAHGNALHPDKAIADNAGVDFVCVLSGETTPKDLEAYQGTPPSIVVETFDKVDAAQS